MNPKKFTLYIICAIISSISTFAQNNIVEEVAWTIGDQPIYKSDIEEMYQQMQYDREPINGDPYCVIPERIAIDKLFLHQAEIDTIEAQESMVQQQVDSRINYFITNLGSREKVESYFRQSISELRETLAENIRDQYRIQEVQRSLTKDIKITPSDVNKYFNTLSADSLPFVPLQVEVQIITLYPYIPQQEIEDVKARLRDYSDRINSGESDFSTLAIFYSEDGSSVRGGEIGFLGRAQLEPEYAAVAFNLNDTKKVSKIVETQYGFHIIQLIEKRGERINTRHILLTPKVSDKDMSDALIRLDSLRSDIIKDKLSFEEAALYMSQDKDTRNSNGIMVNENTGTTRFEMAQLPQEISQEIDKLQPGEITNAFVMKEPKSNRDIVAIVKLTNRIEGHKANLSDDYQQIKGMYENSIKAQFIYDWLDKKINDTYTRIEDGWRNCTFEHDGWIKTINND